MFGARMHYAVPSILAEDQKLLTLYNDFNAYSLPAWARSMAEKIPNDSLQRLLQRRPNLVPKGKIKSNLSISAQLHWRRKSSASFASVVEAEIAATQAFANVALRHGMAEADASFTFDRAGLEIMQAMKANGKIALMEQTVAPAAKLITVLRRESAALSRDEESGWKALSARERKEWELADLIFCGSNFVRDSIILEGAAPAKCVVVPYGVDAGNYKAGLRKGAINRPLRMLFVGEVGARKGARYLIDAAHQLGDRVEVKMVGGIRADQVDITSLPNNLELVGKVPRSDVASWYDWADIFILPSLFEGSATVTYEAMASGLPVICTHETGSIVVNGVSGLIIPSRSSEAIIEAISSITPDRISAWSKYILNDERRWDRRSYSNDFLRKIQSIGL